MLDPILTSSLGIANAMEYPFWLGSKRLSFYWSFCWSGEYFPCMVGFPSSMYIACMHVSILKIAWWFPKEETRVQCCCLWHCLWWKFWKGIISRLPSICGIFVLSSYVIHACIPAHMHMHEYGSMAKGGLLWCAEACCWWNGLDGPRLPLLGQPSQGVKLANWNQPLWHWAWICSEGKLHGFKDPCMHACIFPTGTHI